MEGTPTERERRDKKLAAYAKGGAVASGESPGSDIFRKVCVYILVAELCERLAYYGLTGSLSIFIADQLGLQSNTASQLTSTFASVCYATPILGGYLADTYLGRYHTILLFCSIYVLGMAACTLAAWPSLSSRPIFFTGLFLGVALGTGGIKPNVVVLGAEQFDVRIPAQAVQQRRFFNYFYWSINLGATVSFGYLAYLATHGAPALGIPRGYGFFASFAVPTGAMLVAVLAFAAGGRRYKTSPPSGSALADFCAVVSAGAAAGGAGLATVGGAALMLPAFALSVWSIFTEGATALALAIGAGVLIAVSVFCLVYNGQSAAWLEKTRASNGGAHAPDTVDGVAATILLLPLMGFLIVFWAVYQQMTSNFALQVGERWRGSAEMRAGEGREPA